MATIVGDKLKLTNYSYLLNSEGDGWNEDKLNNLNLRRKSEKLIDAVDIDWRPFSINNCAGDGTYLSYEIKPGDLLETETLINYISYAYSMSKDFTLESELTYNLVAKRPILLTNLYFDYTNRKLAYHYWPTVGSIYDIDAERNEDYLNDPTQFGEIFNDYENNIASGNCSHAEGFGSHAEGSASHAEGSNTYATGSCSHAEGLGNHAEGIASHAEGSNTTAYGQFSHSQGLDTIANSDYSTAIGLGTQATYSDAEIAIGKWNISKEGYLLTIGNGENNDSRNNVVEITNNGWTYIGALYSYVNNLTASTNDIIFDENFENFIKINSYNTLERSNENSYNLQFKSYVVPTKNYIDRLLEAKDVLHFAGGIEFNDDSNSYNEDGTVSGVNWIHKNPISDTYDPEDITYYGTSAYAAGALWKVCNFGYFGNIYCQAGDVLLSYSDDAHADNSTYWLLVGSHIGVIINNPQISENNQISNEENNIITNINLSENGTLTYVITKIISSGSDDEQSIFLNNLMLDKDDDGNTVISYTYSRFVNEHENGTSYDVSNSSDEFGFIGEVNFNENGKLSYKISSVSGLKNHHTYEGSEIASTSLDINDNKNDFVISYISNVHLSESGKLSYTYSSYTISNLKNHHSGSIDTGVEGSNLSFGESFKIIKRVELSNSGTLSGNTTTYTLPSLSINNIYDDNENEKFVYGINVNNSGEISYSYSYVKKITTEKTLNHNVLNNTAGERPTLITNISFNQNNKKLSYSYWPAVGSVYKPSEFDTDAKKNDYVNNQGNYGEVFNDYKNNKAQGSYSHAEGSYAIAYGESSHAEGRYCYAKGSYSHAEGYFAYAYGQCSHSGGYFTYADGNYSFARGEFSYAFGGCSVAIGSYAKTSKHLSMAIGQGAYAINGVSEIALGKWNISKEGYLFTIGDGENDSNRHNAFEITLNGYTYITNLAGVWDYWGGSSTINEEIDYFYIENISNRQCEVTLSKDGSPASISLEYSYDRTSWTTFTTNGEGSFDIPAKSKAYIRGTNSSFSSSSSNYYKLSFGKQCNIGGRLMSLVGGATNIAPYMFYNLFSGNTNLVSAENLILPNAVAQDCYYGMFAGCTSLISAPTLPATTLATSCYQQMFYGCTSLVDAPALPATTLAHSCYWQMFQGCTSLISAPALPATTLVHSCYTSMFVGCTSLIGAPDLPATSLDVDCYYQMFQGCTALVNAPALPATTLTERCYYQMFQGCTSLETAPYLPAITLVTNCYIDMFKNCSKIKKIKAMFKTTPETIYTSDWLSGVASSGIFIKNGNSNANWNVTGPSGIPEGWKIYKIMVSAGPGVSFG